MYILEKAKEFFLKTKNEFGHDPYILEPHILGAERWAKYMFKRYPKINQEIVLLSVWLHDIGHYSHLKKDHAIISEKKANEFLTSEKYPEEKKAKVLHCVRAHRCRDVLPETLEAKTMVFVDSASHFIDYFYIDMLKDNKYTQKKVDFLGKLERDYRDLSFFPEIKEDLKEIYDCWKKLLLACDKIDLNK